MSANTTHLVFREDGNILIKDVRLSYPHLFKPWAKEEFDENGKPVSKKFSGSFIMPLGTHKADVIALKKHIEELSQTSFKQKLSPERYCLRDGNLNGKEEYAKSWYIASSQTSDRPPQVCDRNPKNKITEENNNNRIYAGCRVNVLVRLWAQNNTKGGKRINANLLVVQFVRDDEAFGDGAVPNAENVFEDISGDFPDEATGLESNGGGDLDFSEDEIPF